MKMDKNQNTLTDCNLENLYVQQLCNGLEKIVVDQTDECGSNIGHDSDSYCSNDDSKKTIVHQHYQQDFQCIKNTSNKLVHTDVEMPAVSIEAIENQKATILCTGSNITKREILQETKQENLRGNIIVEIVKNDDSHFNLDYLLGQENQNQNRSYHSYSNLIKMYCCQCKMILRNVTNCRCEKCQSPLKFQCLKCNGLYRKHIAVLNHIKYECYSLSKFNCDCCTYTTYCKFSLMKHVQKKHPVSNKLDHVYQCSGCGKKFEKHQFLLRHNSSCDKRSIKVCHYCSYRCSSKSLLAHHIKEKHEHYQYK